MGVIMGALGAIASGIGSAASAVGSGIAAGASAAGSAIASGAGAVGGAIAEGAAMAGTAIGEGLGLTAGAAESGALMSTMPTGSSMTAALNTAQFGQPLLSSSAGMVPGSMNAAIGAAGGSPVGGIASIGGAIPNSPSSGIMDFMKDENIIQKALESNQEQQQQQQQQAQDLGYIKHQQLPNMMSGIQPVEFKPKSDYIDLLSMMR